MVRGRLVAALHRAMHPFELECLSDPDVACGVRNDAERLADAALAALEMDEVPTS